MSERVRIDHPYGEIDVAYATSLATRAPDDDGPAYMVNLMRYKPVAEYADGRESTLTGKEADDEYAPTEVLADIGAVVVLFGDVIDQTRGETAWDRVGIVRYPTRRSFVEMQQRRDFADKHAHKAAGMERTIVAVCLPPADEAERLDARLRSDEPLVLHLVRHGDAPAPVDPGHLALRVEGTVIGDGTPWDEVRFARGAHDAPAAADAHSVVIRPTIDRLAVTAPAGADG
ncbi:MAG TPA: hypothetical protein VK866_12390 [Acidimicrobiales bacterium]|nr:hypothetical protein [Acidimicrobiales bacterium]